MYLDPALASSPRLPPPEDFSSAALGHIYATVKRRLASGADASAALLGGELSGEEMSLLVRLLQKPETLSNSKKALEDYINRISARRASGSDGGDLMKILEQRRKEISEG